jgi:hypothetical protein
MNPRFLRIIYMPFLVISEVRRVVGGINFVCYIRNHLEFTQIYVTFKGENIN